MSGIRPILNLIALAYYRWARAEIDPMHPDLTKVVVRCNELETGYALR